MDKIWDDINNEEEAIMIKESNYDPASLTNVIAEIIDDKVKRKQTFKKNEIKGMFSDLENIRKHRDQLAKDEIIDRLLETLFVKEEILTITPLDRVYLNSYYRRLLRAKLELDYKNSELPSGLVIGTGDNMIDGSIVKTMKLLRLICKYLGINSTTHETSFPKEKLAAHSLWRDLSEKFSELMGEKIPIIDNNIEEIHKSNNSFFNEEQKKMVIQTKSYMFLNLVFNAWSGTILKADGENVKVVPAIYVSRLLSKLKE